MGARQLAPSLADALWKRVGPGRMARAVRATVEVTSPGREPKVAGSGPALGVGGDPGELTLFGSGRQRAARVELVGDDGLVEALRREPLGM